MKWIIKKVIWSLFLILVFNSSAKAEIFYSDYIGPGYSDQYVTSTDINKVEHVKFYNWFKENKIPLNYQIYESDKLFLEDDCYYTEYTDYSSNKPAEHESRVVETKREYTYQIPDKVRYIHLTDLSGSYDSLRITELNVLVDGNSINYDYECDGCWGNFQTNINNSIWAENESYIYNGGSLIIDLKNEYSIDKIDLTLYIFDIGYDVKTYELTYSKDKINKYPSKKFEFYFNSDVLIDAKKFNHQIYDLGLNSNEWSYRYVTNVKLNEHFLSENVKEEYRYKEKWCRLYKTERIYSNVYSENMYRDYNLKDEYVFANYYKVWLREKIEVKDIIITDKEKVEDFIYSDHPYKVTGEVDYNKNGVYSVEISNHFVTLNKDVLVDRKEIIINEQNEIINDLRSEIVSLQIKLIKENEKYESLKKEYEILIESMNTNQTEIINKYNEEIFILNDTINNLKVIIEEQKNKILLLDNFNEELLKKIEDLTNEVNDLTVKLTNEYEKNKKLVNEINNLYQENSYLTNLNEVYYNKITEQKDNTDELKKQIVMLINERSQMLNNHENILFSKTQDYENKITEIINSREKIKQVNETNEKVLNEKINNYTLRINQKNKSIFTIISILLLLLIVYIIYKIQKKSNEKNI